MSDATSPMSDSLSTNSDAQPTQSSDSISSDGDVFPFLVHSQDSVTNGEPPEVDNGKLARQKRKRTSAEDQATLEAEYKCNPKPDKSARLEIVKRVSLGEKEVQIWFQNRRQNTRRKSRPLLPHEIAAFGLGGMAALTSDAHTENSIARTEDINRTSPNPGDTVSGNQKDERSHGGFHNWDPVSRLTLTRPEESAEKTSDASLPKVEDIRLPAEPRSSGIMSPTELPTSFRSYLPYQDLPNTLGYLSNRRNVTPNIRSTFISSEPDQSTNAGSRLSLSMCTDSSGTSEDSVTTVSSQVRLSMSLDGKAELVSSQSSPQRTPQPFPVSARFDMSHRRAGLKRNHSEIPVGHVRHNAISGLPHVPRIPSGRSRDARTWEFCCDTDSRDELTTQAENESSGSAVAAISLLRSTSVMSKANTNKRPAIGPKPNSKGRSKRSKLARASSSLARLQGSSKLPLGSPSGDSDKENWLPFAESDNSQHRDLKTSRLPNRRPQQALVESASDLTGTVDQDRLKVSGKSTISNVEIFEDQDGRNNANSDVEKFMKGEVSPSKKGDLDCIQGLLSLSQGIWR